MALPVPARPAALPARPGRPSPAAPAGDGTKVLVGFVALQFACQLALLFETLAPFRAAFRTGSFAVSLLLLVLLPPGRLRHPSRSLGLAAVAVLGMSVFNPGTNTPLAGVAAVGLYTAILAPLFWVPRLRVGPAVFARLVAVLFGFHVLSSTFGVLQVLYPGQFQPAVSSVVQGLGEVAEGMKIQLVDGTSVWRPMGLTDMPGGAAAAGMYAVLFGMGYVVASRNPVLWAAGAGGMAVGLFCIYMAQVRSILVVCGIAAVAVTALLAVRGRVTAAVRLGGIVVGVVVFALGWAVAVGGEGVTKRLETLVEERPEEVYYSNRGRFLEDTIEEQLPKYPLGAGLGRWGMVRAYFGNENNPDSEAIWVEIQWTAWLLDGGVPFTLLYAGAVVVAVVAAARTALRCRDEWLAGWAALVAAYGVGVCGMTFNYVPFIGQTGLEFWLLNATLFVAAVTVERAGRRPAAA